MPVSEKREYRAMAVLAPSETKRLDSDYYVEGYATTFDDPYVLYEYDGIKYTEVIDRNALVGADTSDVIMQYDHSGRVFARNKMGKNKMPTLIVEADEKGIFIAADLSQTEESRKMYDEIDKGLIYQMSWAFTVAKEEYVKDMRLRKLTKIKKVYDVSAVSIPANPSTDISSRNWLNGVIEAEKQEMLEKREKAKKKLLLQIKLEQEKL